jgi:hypothetical protein
MHSVFLFSAGFIVSCFVCFAIIASECVFMSIKNRLRKKTKNE